MWTEVVVAYFKFLLGKLSKGLRKTVGMCAYMFIYVGYSQQVSQSLLAT